MAIWAYACRPCSGKGNWLVSREWVDALPPEVTIVRVKSGSDWRCAVVDRSHSVEVEAMLLRPAEAASPHGCPDCASAPQPLANDGDNDAHDVHVESADLQAAAISLQDRQMLVVLVSLALARSGGEADMFCADLRLRFGDIAVVLMGQDDGSPHYHGDPGLLRLLADVPIDKMPWKRYSIS